MNKQSNRIEVTLVKPAEIIIYNTQDGEVSVSLFAKDGNVWLNQNQLAELFATSKQNVSLHISNILEDKELSESSVVKYYLTTAADGKEYNTVHYALPMILALGFRVRGPRGTQFRKWANHHLHVSNYSTIHNVAAHYGASYYFIAAVIYTAADF